MGELVEGENGVIAAEQIDIPDGWTYTTTHIYTTKMVTWITTRDCVYGYNYVIQTYRLLGHAENSHRWYFKDPEVATLFAIVFS